MSAPLTAARTSLYRQTEKYSFREVEIIILWTSLFFQILIINYLSARSSFVINIVCKLDLFSILSVSFLCDTLI